MATRTKTIEYAWDQNYAGVASATRYDFPAMTVYNPETGSRTFRMASFEFSFRDNATTAPNLSNVSMWVKIGAAAEQQFFSLNETWTGTGEHRSYVVAGHCTSYFQTNFTGTSQTVIPSIRVSGVAVNNIACKLILTYDYDDSLATTRIKTVRIPIESNDGQLGTTLASMPNAHGGYQPMFQVPALDTWLPEASKVYRDIFFEFQTNEASVGTGDVQLAVALDAEAEVLDGVHEQALNSSCYYRRLWKRTDIDTSVEHDLKARSTLLGPRWTGFGGWLTVTYEYDHAASTTILNHVLLPYSLAQTIDFADMDDEDSRRTQVELWIEEPGAITLQRSAAYATLIARNDVSGWFITAGDIAVENNYYQPNTLFTGTDTCGMLPWCWRLDDRNSWETAFLSLSRGLNTIPVLGGASDTTDELFALTGMVIVNYTSGKHADGDGAHNHTIMRDGSPTVNDTRAGEIGGIYPAFADTPSYFVSSFGFELGHNRSVADAMVSIFKRRMKENVFDPLPTAGWQQVWADAYGSDPERAQMISYADATQYTLRYPNAPVDADLGDLKGTAAWPQFYAACLQEPTYWHASRLITYHTISYTVAGTLTGFTGDGSAIEVRIYRSDTNELVGIATTAIGGGYTFTWYDNTIQLYAEARQDSTHVGRSDNGVAV